MAWLSVSPPTVTLTRLAHAQSTNITARVVTLFKGSDGNTYAKVVEEGAFITWWQRQTDIAAQ